MMLQRSILLGLLWTLSASALAPNSNNNPLQQHNGEVSRRGAFLQTAAAAVTAVTATTFVTPANAVPQTGISAPTFELPNSRGEGTTTLKDLVKTGKWTVLYFYPGAFTSGCTLEARYFQRDIDQYRQLNAQIVGVSVDPVEKNKAFCSAENLDFFMLSDQGGKVSQAYGSALSIPGFGTFSNRQTYLIDPNGELRWIFNDVESHIPRHSEEVLGKLRDLEGAVKA
ncbi:Peroxiredoxin Q, chloroplastic [Seminavis robusta]|uniref:thioredoxin-dependent peroxiredoxin n=1 Tax=Seminavis robusta TaxID=568900 RepID=A0A9N8DSQ7_9STRA|nr:Peroxiredoxin Q, chloroplastic [Seminavis robusta]|eukprot:Sro251_g099370.1 Peroxiredoxin Q, chloroplastic (226) ;mRNA; r:68525-69202